jgi:hypothetical protein
MIIELITGAVIFLFLFYMFVEWNSKRQLKKMREAYNPKDDTSRRENQQPRTTDGSVIPREQPLERIEQSEGGRVLETSSDKTTTDVERQLIPNESNNNFLKRFRRSKKQIEEDKSKEEQL